MKIKVKRQDCSETLPYWQVFTYELTKPDTVAGILEGLNDREELTDENGNPCRRIKWERSCLQKACGGCAMVINSTPALACSTTVDPEKTEELIIEPLTKFPVISDLYVDRSCISEYLKEAGAYTGTAKENPADFEKRYDAAKCLKCGLCLEICPNYTGPEGRFFGALWAGEAHLISSTTENRKKDIKKEYSRHFLAGCSKNLACRSVCPLGILTLSSVSSLGK